MSDGKFIGWWSRTFEDKPTRMHKVCFEEGYEHGYTDGYEDGASSVRMIRWAMVCIAAVVIAILAGCQDRFRYPCMDKSNWDKEECQRPMCAITQTCPDQLMKAEDIKGEVR